MTTVSAIVILSTYLWGGECNRNEYRVGYNHTYGIPLRTNATEMSTVFAISILSTYTQGREGNSNVYRVGYNHTFETYLWRRECNTNDNCVGYNQTFDKPLRTTVQWKWATCWLWSCFRHNCGDEKAIEMHTIPAVSILSTYIWGRECNTTAVSAIIILLTYLWRQECNRNEYGVGYNHTFDIPLRTRMQWKWVRCWL